MRVVHLHGFGSSPTSPAAQALRAELEARGVAFVAPDLNVPTFERLDWRAVVDAAVAAVEAARPDVVVGKSLGGLVAVEASRRAAPARRLVLVAPTLGFGPLWTPPLPDGDPVPIDDRLTGTRRLLHRAFVEAYLAGPEHVPAPPVAATVIAGGRDTVNPPSRVRAAFEAWRASGALRPGSRYVEIPDAAHAMDGCAAEIAGIVIGSEA